MEQPVVRLLSLIVTNIKNVKEGTIMMPAVKDASGSWRAGMLGIYGPNGSGKTAIIDALYFLRHIMIGNSLDPGMADYINCEADDAEIAAEFAIYVEDVLYEVGYHVQLEKTGLNVCISREYLNCAITRNGIRSNRGILMDYRRLEPGVFKPQKHLDELVSGDKDLLLDLVVAKKLAEKENCSYIFGDSSREIFCRSNHPFFENGSFIICSLFQFATKDLSVIRHVYSGNAALHLTFPISFCTENGKMDTKGGYLIPLTVPVILDRESKELFCIAIKQINTVLYTVIPGMRLEIYDQGKQALDSGEDGWKVELMSAREGRRPVPIRMESTGIIRIISLINVLIYAFGNFSACIAIDGLDADIYEYMFGELLAIFQNSAKGQLIFTSHNLRALETLDRENIVFSTTDPTHRFICMDDVKGCDNLRNMYIRSFNPTGLDEEIYRTADSNKMIRAFLEAAQSKCHE